ncbi:galactokinase [bacterium]|nr:galactokinase [bacterium]
MSIESEFQTTFKRPAQVVARAPGRVNLLGGHTDYNLGLALPVAIDRAVHVAVAARDDGFVRTVSRQIGETGEFEIGDRQPVGRWDDGVKGAVAALVEAGGAPTGFDLLVDSDIPMEAGLSSSAAFLVAVASAVFTLNNRPLDGLDLAKTAQRIENDFLGTPCGLLDQMASVLCRPGEAILIDFRDLSTRPVPLPSNLHILVGYTGVARKLASGEYAKRRDECARAVARLRELGELGELGEKDATTLRDVSAEMLDRRRLDLDPLLMRRAFHVVSENERVIAGAKALEDGDLLLLGALLNRAHTSLRLNYEVSCDELDAMVTALRSADGVMGARLVGAGFGGCAIAVAEHDFDDGALAVIASRYKILAERDGRVFAVTPGEGASVRRVSA